MGRHSLAHADARWAEMISSKEEVVSALPIPAMYFMPDDNTSWRRGGRHAVSAHVRLWHYLTAVWDVLLVLADGPTFLNTCSWASPLRRPRKFMLVIARRHACGRVTGAAGRRKSRLRHASIVGAATRHVSVLILVLALIQSPGDPHKLRSSDELVQHRLGRSHRGLDPPGLRSGGNEGRAQPHDC